MKKIFSLLLCGALMAGLVSCDGNEPAGDSNSTGNNSGSNSNGELNTNGHDYVDLGLPSGTLWATCNVGAMKPEESGDYFAWGETTPKEDRNNISWNTYTYGSGAKELTKYCTDASYGEDGFTDNKTVLDALDDAATVNWGGDWRMPTKTEQDELCTECTWEWTDNYNNTSVPGCIVTGTNGNSIFLPADATKLPSHLGVDGYYWSSSLSIPRPDLAGCIGIHRYHGQWSDHEPRHYGFSVRAVCSPR